MKHSTLSSRLLLSVIFFSVFTFLSHANEVRNEAPGDCDNCFSTEVVSIETEDNCVVITLEINADDGCRYALSHFMVAIPCGTVTHAENSGKWPMEFMVKDPTTGLRGLKVDDIKGFGEDKQAGTFILTYRVCSDDSNCLENIKNGVFQFSYKAGQCVFYEDVNPEIPDEPVVLEAEIIASPVSCFGSNDGSVSTSVSGGQAPYSFLWSNGETDSEIQNAVIGIYSVLITDAIGNEVTLSVEVKGPSPILISGKITHANCAQSSGSIELTVSGGQGGYSYLWSHGADTRDVTELTAGSYIVTVTDSSGCSAKMPFLVNSQSPIQLSAATTMLKCHENGSGTINLNVWGGTEPYSFEWSNGATTQNVTGLNAGNHRVTITDAEGCTLVRAITVRKEIFYVTPSITHADCMGENGTVTLVPKNGNGPYIAAWSNGESGLEVNGLSAGTYIVVVTDVNGCRISQQLTVTSENAVNINATVSAMSCMPDDGDIQVDLSATGGTAPYTFFLNGDEIGSSFIVADEGEYLVEVVDINGCSASENVNITRPESSFSIHTEVTGPNCSNTTVGSATIYPKEGQGPYTYLWNDEEGAASRDDLAVGNHQVVVIDSRGCEASAIVVIEEVSLPTVSIVSPVEAPECNSADNLITAHVTNGQTYNWAFYPAGTEWAITDHSMSHVVYNASNGEITLNLTVISPDGCEASDFIVLGCSDGSDDDGSSDSGDDGDDDDVVSDGCMSSCVYLDKSVVSAIGSGCYRYELTFVTDGSCRYELSHLVIDLGGYKASNVSNSRNWKLEINSTDPKSGLRGIKVDDISGFGKVAGDSFTVTFELCNAAGFDAGNYKIAYKAGQCLEIVESDPVLSMLDNRVQLVVYPNPAVTDTYFEFVASADTHGVLTLINQSGVPVAKLFDGKMKKGITYKVSYSVKAGEDMVLFYQLVTRLNNLEGKILRIK